MSCAKKTRAAIMFGLVGMVVVVGRAEAITSATNGYWTNGATWVGGSVPGAGDEVVIANGTYKIWEDRKKRKKG